MDFVYKFPVVRGYQAGSEYYIAMVPLKMLEKLFPYDDEFVLPEYRAQRRLNCSRIPIISKYILDNRDSYVFSALAASIDGEFRYEPSSSNSEIGVLEISMSSRFLINDGQHRKSAILEAIKEDPTLGDETISIVLYSDKGLERSQQIFTDLNKNAVKTSNSISELYDSRDSMAVVTRTVVNQASTSSFTVYVNWPYENTNYYKIPSVFPYSSDLTYYIKNGSNYYVQEVTSATYDTLKSSLYLEKDEIDSYIGEKCGVYQNTYNKSCLVIKGELVAEQANTAG